MSLLCTDSLAATLDAVNLAQFSHQRTTAATRKEVAHWLVAQTGKPGAFRPGMVAPTAKDRIDGIQVFTGERIWSWASVGHVLGEEACRALITLAVKGARIDQVIESTANAIIPLISAEPGGYCCGRCTVSVWRLLSVGGLDDQERQLIAGMLRLNHARMENGRWAAFPFYYTLLALTEITVPGAKEEKEHAARACERMLKRPRAPEPYGSRREAIMRTILAQV